MKKKISIYFIIITILLTGCGGITYDNKMPDDEISRAVYEALGTDVYYVKSYKNEFDVICYWYIVKSYDSDLLYKFVTTINEAIEENEITEKVSISYMTEIPGCLASIIELSNYSNRVLKKPDYEKLQHVEIEGTMVNVEKEFDFYNDPSTYFNLPDVRYLEVNQKINDQAKEQGINWYEVWPDLEQMEIFQHRD